MGKENILRGFLVGICMAALLSCTAEKAGSVLNNGFYTIDLDTVSIDHEFKYSDLFDSARFIRLDNKQVLLGKITKLDVYKDNLVVLDMEMAQGVFMFDKNGNFIRRIGNVGAGPEDYTRCTDFAIDAENTLIYVCDNFGMKIIAYDLNTGVYVKTLNLDIGQRFNRIWCNSGSLYAVKTYFEFSDADNAENYILKRLDKDTGREIMQWMDVFMYNKGWHDEVLRTPLFYHIKEGRDLFAFGLSDTIMCIENGEVSPYIALSGDKTVKPKDLSDADINPKESDVRKRTDMLLKLLSKLGKEQGKVLQVTNIFENDGYLYFEYIAGRGVLTKCNLLTGAVTSSATYKNDVLFSEKPENYALPSFLTSDSIGVYYCLGTEQLSDYQRYCSDGMVSDRLKNRDLINSLDEDSNPVILYYEFSKK